MKTYKLFRAKNGNLSALYIDAKKVFPMHEWIKAEIGVAAKPTKTGNERVKSKIGPLSFRPGFHSGDLPLATHIGPKQDNGIRQRRFNEVWAEIEIKTDIDYQAEANENGRNKKGKIIAVNADIKKIPVNGFYRYKTNPAMTGTWIISGEMKIKKVLTENEVNAILKKNNVESMTWENGNLDLKSLGF